MPLQLLDNNGRPIAGGCVFTYVSGTTTPLASYSDAAGMVLNANPVILDSAGRARIFLTAAAYTLKLVTQGGVNCASGVAVWTIEISSKPVASRACRASARRKARERHQQGQ
jgi:hypothetical protein